MLCKKAMFRVQILVVKSGQKVGKKWVLVRNFLGETKILEEKLKNSKKFLGKLGFLATFCPLLNLRFALINKGFEALLVNLPTFFLIHF